MPCTKASEGRQSWAGGDVGCAMLQILSPVASGLQMPPLTTSSSAVSPEISKSLRAVPTWTAFHRDFQAEDICRSCK